ncbi:peptidylprolyl isomerase [Parasphingorhabdus halotolerans]|uniref:Peptidylprolyl isomerase n=1 Tax=Parasphingorhabdus halotolerans TaxID=2725558 RepID=A0A6H2DN43_9SPHN|nr:peptidylprolyl isomerase [Parasphingorhabdus halotolerans]QJB69608.1 peptidylprolyl isomerase [Parasphingorhabdus halotolerans]
MSATPALSPSSPSRFFSSLTLSCFLLCSTAALAQDDSTQAQDPTPEDVLAAAPAEHWLPIPVNDLMIFTLPDAADGKPRQAIIQLLPANLSGGHVRNVRKLAQNRWWDGTKIYRVAKDFVTQFGGNPDGKALPKNLETVPESEYFNAALGARSDTDMQALDAAVAYANAYQKTDIKPLMKIIYENTGASKVGFGAGWPIGSKTIDGEMKYFPITCRGSLSPAHYDPPDAGSGAEISVVTGEAARSLDTTFGMVGRVIDGLEHLVNLPPGDAAGGFYASNSSHIPITSIRLASELPLAEQPRYEYLASYSPSLLQYIAAHGGYGNICTVGYPTRSAAP